jgi:hypothetical protein
MATSKDPHPPNVNQPVPKIIDNPPVSSLAQSLANAKAQVSKAK